MYNFVLKKKYFWYAKLIKIKNLSFYLMLDSYGKFSLRLSRLQSLGPVHTKTIVNANASKRKLFYALRPSVHTKTMKTLTVNA